jgi:hypothetical protein
MMKLSFLCRVASSRVVQSDRRLGRRKRRFVGAVEAMEKRDQPSQIVFPYPGMIVGDAVLSNGHTRNSYYLSRGFANGDLATVTPRNSLSLTESTASLRFNGSNTSQEIELTSKAYADNTYRPASAQVHTTAAGVNTGPGFITVTINPTYGDYIGKPVFVTLDASYMNTNITTTTGHNFVQVAYIPPGSNNATFLINGTDYSQPPGGRIYRGHASFYTTVGSSFRIGMVAYSYAQANASSGADLKLDITER